jgi:hypothetical protein
LPIVVKIFEDRAAALGFSTDLRAATAAGAPKS